MTGTRNAREMYTNYIKEMNELDVAYHRELIAYQDWGECFAVISLTVSEKFGVTWTDFMIMHIDWECNVLPIRTYSNLGKAMTTFYALAYWSKPIVTLPF